MPWDEECQRNDEEAMGEGKSAYLQPCLNAVTHSQAWLREDASSAWTDHPDGMRQENCVFILFD